MKFSQKGEKLLINEEGYKNEPYLDVAGHWTIGIGHKIKQGERFTTLTDAEVIQLMKKDIEPIECFINNYMPRLTQNQFDALVIFIFNIGAPAFLNSSVFSIIKDKKFEEATKPWAKWINITERVKDPKTGEIVKKLIPVEALIKRRAVEIKLFNS
jgi:lysozyme